MRLKVIGTGSQGNAYLLYNEQEALLIECGVNIEEIKKAINFEIDKIVGCITSHSHGDHFKSVQKVLDLGIDIYASNETFSTTLFPNSGHRRKEISQGKVFNVGNFKILPFELKHDVPCLGFLINHQECGKIVFITDTYYCKYTFPGLNNIIIEANYCKDIINKRFGKDTDKEFLRNRVLRSHFSIQNCLEMLSANDLSEVNNIVLIHLSDGNSNENEFVTKVQNITGKSVSAAYNGMDIPFNKTPF